MADLTAFHEMYDEQEKLLDIFDNRPDHTPLFFLYIALFPIPAMTLRLSIIHDLADSDIFAFLLGIFGARLAYRKKYSGILFLLCLFYILEGLTFNRFPYILIAIIPILGLILFNKVKGDLHLSAINMTERPTPISMKQVK